MTRINWPETTYVYDYDKIKLKRSFGSLKAALAFCSSNTKKHFVVTFRKLKRKTKTELDLAFVYSPKKKKFKTALTPQALLKNIITNRDAMENKITTGMMEYLVWLAKQAYYNTETPIMSDAKFDFMEKLLKKRNRRSYALQTGADIVETETTAGKVTLPFYMGSMNKVSNVDNWQHEGPYWGTDKLDGISLLYHNNNGTHKLYTRGNGTVGQDVTHLLSVLSLPKLPNGHATRHEIIMSEAKFKKYNVDALGDEGFKNARNMMAGLTNRKDVSDILKDADVVAFEYVWPRIAPSKGHAKLKQKGFKVVRGATIKSLDVAKLTNLLEKRKSTSKYAMDGLVIEVDYKTPLNMSGNPDHAFAFKKNLESDMVEVRVTGVEWNVSRLGQVKPTVLFETVDLKGVSVSRATGHNAKYILENKIGKNAIIKIVRSGDVIPYVVEVIKKAKKADMPDIEYEWDDTETNIISVDKNTQAQKSSQLAYSLAQLGIENIGASHASTLVENGYDDISKLYNVKAADISDIGEGRAAKLVKDLKLAFDNASVVDLMVASGVFGMGFGRLKFEGLLEQHPEFCTLNAKEIKELKTHRGFSAASIVKIANSMKDFDKFLKAIKRRKSEMVIKVKKASSSKLKGKVFLFTGVRDAKLQEAITDNGGKVSNSFNGSVTHLVVKDKGTSSSKANKARQAGIPLILIDEAWKMINGRKGMKVYASIPIVDDQVTLDNTNGEDIPF